MATAQKIARTYIQAHARTQFCVKIMRFVCFCVDFNVHTLCMQFFFREKSLGVVVVVVAAATQPQFAI